MIILHKGASAPSRIEGLSVAEKGKILNISPKGAFSAHIDEVAKWLSKTDRPGFIVVAPAAAADKADRDAFESLRRMAKFQGVDVHLHGDDTMQFVADKVVENDEDMVDTAPGSDVGARILALMQSETMTPLEPAAMDIPTAEEIMAMSKATREQAEARIEWMKSQKIWANNLYQVNVVELPGDRSHIMIRRLDRQPIHNWGHFQEIKNQVLGKECEAVELYPKESLLVDAKHHYHLWGFNSDERSFGIGFDMGRQVAGDQQE